MSEANQSIDLSALPVPALVEPLNFETIYNEMREELAVLDPTLADIPDSDPLAKLLQVCAYRELNIRQRINTAGKAVLLTTATHTDLDNLVAKEPYNIKRLVISEGDPEAVPPVPTEYESDPDLRIRAQLAPARYSTAGPETAYRFWALSAHPDVADASIESPEPVQIVVTVLSRNGNGVPGSEVLSAVEAVLTDKDVRPLTDQVTVQAAEAVEFSISAELTLYPGLDSAVVLQEANNKLDLYLANTRRLGMDITRAGIMAALFVPGVQNITLSLPAADVVIESHKVAALDERAITIGGYDQ